jgi:RND family efflux transporter MFP subunit
MLTTLLFLAAWALRSSILIAAGALLLWALRVKDPSIRLAAFIAMLCGSLLLPVLTIALPKVPLEIVRVPTAPDIREAAPPQPISAAPSSQPGFAETSVAQVSRTFDWTRAALVLYLAVSLALLLRLSIGLALSLRWLRASRATSQTIRGIEIRESERVSAPVTLGILRPAIVLPADWTEWDAVKLDAVLAHERSHVERRDPAVQLLSAIHRALLWFSPLSWFLHRRIVRLAEEVSDDAAIAAMHDRASYAELLLDFMQRPWRVRGLPMARYGRADQRIGRILAGTTLARGVTRGSLAAILALGSPLAWVIAAAHPQQPQAAPAQAPSAPQTTQVAPASDVWTLGSVAATTVTIKPRIDGQLISVSFKEGDTVQAGQLLATIDPRPYQIQLEQAEAQLERDQEQLRAAQGASQATPPDPQAQLRLNLDRLNVERARVQVIWTQISAPISGVTGLRQVDVGNMVYAAADAPAIVVITQLRPIAVVFNLAEDSLPRVRALLSQGANLTAEAWNRNANQKLATGLLTALDNQIDPQTGTVKLKAMFDNKDDALFPNEFVNVRLQVAR